MRFRTPLASLACIVAMAQPPETGPHAPSGDERPALGGAAEAPVNLPPDASGAIHVSASASAPAAPEGKYSAVAPPRAIAPVLAIRGPRLVEVEQGAPLTLVSERLGTWPEGYVTYRWRHRNLPEADPDTRHAGLALPAVDPDQAGDYVIEARVGARMVRSAPVQVRVKAPAGGDGPARPQGDVPEAADASSLGSQAGPGAEPRDVPAPVQEEVKDPRAAMSRAGDQGPGAVDGGAAEAGGRSYVPGFVWGLLEKLDLLPVAFPEAF